MTADRDLTMQLGAWLDDRATSTVPDGLLDRSLARVEATHQRPAWLAMQRRGTAFRPAPLAFVPAWAIVVLIALLAIAVIVVGSQLVRPTTLSLIAEPSISPAPTGLSTEPPATPVPTPIDTRPAAVPADASMFAELGSFFAASDDVAWVSTPTAIYRTEDTGQTWRAVQPAGGSGR